ncbi:two-component system sporulation sensor kinase A [Caldalkalibacillus uzonensis]|uniref:histidine kinase n=1 Tax=Caldalkalibacillus uzonensis TaxID=353224 RepID=A0ABU0CVP9_9BACI|nr:PAS domain S-box protein [Caldalkalibacillus uzonensis]MDQ0340496.1 two-component system sporulation sensor kinase A [Caldalkalibacillus uzonensis]
MNKEKWDNPTGAKGIEEVTGLLDHLPDAFFSLDHNWRFTYVNREAARILLKKREDLIGKCVWDEFPAVGLSFHEQYHRAMTEKMTVKFQEYYPPLDRWFDVRAYPSNCGLSVHFRDITINKRELDESKEHYKSLFEYHPDAVYSVDLQGNFMSVNQSFVKLFGYFVSEALQMNFEPLFDPEDLARTKRHFQLAVQGNPQNYDVTAISKDGKRIIVNVTNLPIFVNNEIIGVYGIAKDITERKLSEEKLRKSETRLALAQIIARLGSWEWNIKENFLFCSNELCKMMGVNPGDIDTYEKFIRFVHPEDRALVQQLVNESLLHRKPYNAVFRIQHPDKQEIFIHAIGEVYFDEQGEPVRMIGTSQDLTERVKAEELMRKSEKLSLAGQLAAGIAHEIRNPLTCIKGFLKLMQAGHQFKQEYIDVMHDELSRIETIVQELLLLAKPHHFKFELHEVQGLIKQVVTLLETEAIMKNVQIMTQFTETNLHIYCDHNQIKQVFINLIKNGIDAMPQGGKLLIKIEQEEDKVAIRFTDHGCGIPNEILNKLGQPFFTTKEKGTGLGLAVSYSIIENHKGTVNVSSTINEGTTFSVYLPLATN